MNKIPNLVIANIIYNLDGINDISSLLSTSKKFNNFGQKQSGFWKRYNRDRVFSYLSLEEWTSICNWIKVKWNHLSVKKILQYIETFQPISYLRYIINYNDNYKEIFLNRYNLADIYIALILEGIDYTKDLEYNNYFNMVGDPIYHTTIREYLLLYLNDMDVFDIDIATENNNAIRVAASLNHGEIVRILLKDSRVDPTTNKNYAIRNSTWKNYHYIARMLLDWSGPNKEKVDPTVINNSAIRWACFNGSTECIQLLLDWVGPNGERIDIHAKGSEAIRFAKNSNNVETKRLVEKYSQSTDTADTINETNTSS